MAAKISVLSTRSSSWYKTEVLRHLQEFPDIYDLGLEPGLDKPLRTKVFADGEMEVELPETIRGSYAYLIASCGRNSLGLSTSEQKVELYHAVDAIKRSAAEKLILIEPYMSSSRSDRTTRRNSVGFWTHCKTLMGLGVDQIITYHLHSDKSKSVLDPAQTLIDDIPAVSLILDYLSSRTARSEQFTVCSNDAGSENLARDYARALGAELIIAYKHRDYRTINTVSQIRVLSDAPLDGKVVWIVDDMIDTGGSLVALCSELVKRGVVSVNAVITHPVFSEPALSRLKELNRQGLLHRLVTTDTLEIGADIREALPFVEVVSTARTTAEAILRIFLGGSLSAFFRLAGNN